MNGTVVSTESVILCRDLQFRAAINGASTLGS